MILCVYHMPWKTSIANLSEHYIKWEQKPIDVLSKCFPFYFILLFGSNMGLDSSLSLSLSFFRFRIIKQDKTSISFAFRKINLLPRLIVTKRRHLCNGPTRLSAVGSLGARRRIGHNSQLARICLV